MRPQLTRRGLLALALAPLADAAPPVATPLLPERKTITLAMKDGVRKHVEADVFGMLAVHRTETRRCDTAITLTITHIPTGFNVRAFLEADEVPELMRRLLPLDWKFDSPSEMPRGTRERASVILWDFDIEREKKLADCWREA